MTDEAPLNNKESADLLRKVRAMLRHTVENGASEAEAAVFAMKASALIAQYNLTQQEIYHVPDKRVRDSVLSSAHKEKWVIWIWGAVGRLNFCKYYYQDGDRRGIVHTLVGTVANVASSQVLAEYLVETVMRLAGKLR